MDERVPAVKKRDSAMMGGTTKPNVFFIVIDDMGWDDIGYQSSDLKGITPNLDKLAADGVKVRSLREKKAWVHGNSVGKGVTYVLPFCLASKYGVVVGDSHMQSVPVSRCSVSDIVDMKTVACMTLIVVSESACGMRAIVPFHSWNVDPSE